MEMKYISYAARLFMFCVRVFCRIAKMIIRRKGGRVWK